MKQTLFPSLFRLHNMKNNQAYPEKGTRKPDEPNIALQKVLQEYFHLLILFALIYIPCILIGIYTEITTYDETKPIIMGAFAGFFVLALVTLLTGKKYKYISRFSITENQLLLVLANLYGQTKNLPIPRSEIEKLKIRPPRSRNSFSRIWFHLPTSIEIYDVADEKLAEALCTDLNVRVL